MALTKVIDNNFTAVDSEKLTAFVLLDFSIDRINYKLLTVILNYIGFSQLVIRFIENRKKTSHT